MAEPKKKPRRARALPGEESLTFGGLNEMRASAGIDYITDLAARPVAFWHGRPERPYHMGVSLLRFQEWCSEDEWVAQRRAYLASVLKRTLEARTEDDVVYRVQEIGRLTEDHALLGEYLSPLRGGDGGVLRHEEGPYEGLPILPLEMVTLDKMAKIYIDLGKHLMLLRGDPTSRTESTTETRLSVSGGVDTLEAKVQLAREDIRALGQALLERHQPELIDGQGELKETYDGADD